MMYPPADPCHSLLIQMICVDLHLAHKPKNNKYLVAGLVNI